MCLLFQKLAKDETKSIAEQKEKIRAELQEVYQKQVDEVVKAKLQEFQTQLDNAESEFLEELKTRQQVIAECAARKIKDVIDKFVRNTHFYTGVVKYIQINFLNYIRAEFF